MNSQTAAGHVGANVFFSLGFSRTKLEAQETMAQSQILSSHSKIIANSG